MTAIQTIQAWSFSRYNDYEKCPRYAKFKFIDKMKEPDNKYQAKGAAIHKSAEQFLLGNAKLAPELNNFKYEFGVLKNNGAIPELQWAFTQDWTPTGWFDKNAWCRIKTDAVCVLKDKLYVIDFKTGKIYDNHTEQLELYALGGFITNPQFPVCETQDWYLEIPAEDERALQGEEWNIKDLPKLKKAWEKKTKPMLTDMKFAPKPGNHCRFCHFRKGNDGPCNY